jgi:translation elongation factor EF-1beta
MSKVAVVFKIYANDGEFETALKNLTEQLKPAGTATDDVGFGIKVIKALFKFDDTETSSSKIEEQIKKLAGVSEVEVFEESLL